MECFVHHWQYRSVLYPVQSMCTQKYGAHAVWVWFCCLFFSSSLIVWTFSDWVDSLKILWLHLEWWSHWSLSSTNYKMFSTQSGRMPYSFPRSSLLGLKARAKGKYFSWNVLEILSRENIPAPWLKAWSEEVFCPEGLALSLVDLWSSS